MAPSRPDLTAAPPGALAALGVAAADRTVASAPASARVQALAAALTSPPTPWRVPAALPADLAAWDAAWHAAAPHRDRPYRLHARRAQRAVLARLVLAAGPVAVAEDDPGLREHALWGSRPRVGVLPGAARGVLGAGLRPLELGTDAASCDLLVLTSADDVSRAAHARGLDAAAVLAVGAAAGDRSVRAAALAVGAAGYALLPTGGAATGHAVATLLAALGTAPLDVAVWGLAAGPGWLDGPARVVARSELLRPPAPSAVLQRDPPAEAVRVLQAQASAGDSRRLATLLPDAHHVLTLRVGPGDPGWISTDRPFPDPVLDADPGSRSATLTMVLVPPDGAQQVADVQLDLAPGRASTPASFDVLVRRRDADAHRVWSADVLVHHAGRLLEYAVLSGPLGVRDGAVRGRRLELRGAALARANASGLDERRPFDAALTRLRGGRSLVHRGPRDNHVLDARTFEGAAEISAELSAAAAAEGDRATLRRAWRRLAEHGHRLRVLLHDAGAGHLDDARRIQLVDSVPDDLVPLEFVFTGGVVAPSARPCTGWVEALRTGSCPTCAPPPRPLDEKAAALCPLHFWGLEKVIERSVHLDRPDTGVLLRTEPTPGRRRLARPGAALLAVTDLVGGELLAEPLAAIRAAVPRTVGPLRTWRSWWGRVRRDRAPLVLVIAHNTGRFAAGRRFSTGSLSIGADSRLTPEEVGRRWALPPDGAPTLVFLLACNSVDPDLPTAGFAARFRQGGAAVVVGSIADLEADVAPLVARHLVGTVTGGWPADTSMGDAMRAVRRGLVEKEHPAGMGLTAFGDADWLLA